MKQELRARHIEGRKALGQKLREDKSALIAEHLLSLESVRNATMIMLYAEMGAEVITRPLIRRLLAKNKRVVLHTALKKRTISELPKYMTSTMILSQGRPMFPNRALN
jgi:5-formyltetrahydrofolate cyclo-ligase